MRAKIVSCGLLVASVVGGQASRRDAHELLHRAMEAQGGEQVLRSIRAIRFEASGYRNELEQSERPEGPYVTEFNEIAETHDQAQHRSRSVVKTRVPGMYEFETVTVVANGRAALMRGGRAASANLGMVQAGTEKLALSPERLLITASDAPDVHLEADTVLHSLPQHVVAFSLDGAPVKIYLNAYTLVPTAVDYSGPLAATGFWAYRGDVTMRTWYGTWWLAKGGVRIPLQANVEHNGQADSMSMISKLEIDPEIGDADFAISEESARQFRNEVVRLDDFPLGKKVSEIARGVVQIEGAWNVGLVRQGDGIVVLEAPISSGYSAKVIEEAGRRWPGMRIKAVVTTSDSWPHIAGIREYAARGIPIYALDLNRAVLNGLLGESRTRRPDLYAGAPKGPQFTWVKDRTEIGSGQNRISLFPLRGETTERQMMAYFPELRLLYGSDAFQQRADKTFFVPETVSELLAAVAREQLPVERFFMMHVGVTPWADLGDAVARAKEMQTPNGS